MIKSISNGVLLFVKVVPKSSQTAFVEEEEGYLKIRLAAVPEKGKANKTLLIFLSKALNFPKSKLSIVYGEQGRKKHVFIEGIKEEDLKNALIANAVSL